ncbi:hypothetical protein HYQ45_012010 [Verticillium longisporum]|uniref:Ion transport domain-containing protein n=1 Tax=Verticillium longisporum TaxID=100787 RepID=A0A8I2ZER4_VERLO|nr:hypothetical protein HYQ45_012010 [Verticillium longisporum]
MPRTDDTQLPLLGDTINEHPEQGLPEAALHEPQQRAQLPQLLSSRRKHMVVLILVALDVAALLANIFIELATRQTLTTAGLVFSSLFLLELVFCIVAFGLKYLKDWFHCLDAVVIVTSFVVDLLSHGIVEDIASLVIVFRLFRFAKMLEEMSMGAAERIESMANELDKLRMENTLSKERHQV